MLIFLKPSMTNHKFISFIILCFLLLIMTLVFLNWDELLFYISSTQKELIASLRKALIGIKNQQNKSGLMLIFFSFLYGLLHAAGPGHGKVIITTYIAANNETIKQSLILSVIAALLQGVVAIVLVSCVLFVLKTSSKDVHTFAFYLEKISLIIVFVIGILMILKALRGFFKENKKQCTHDHHHDSHDHCNCHHVDIRNNSASLKEKIMLVVSMGFRPCSGAILLLIFSKVIDLFGFGIIATMFMSLGTAITVCIFAFLAIKLKNNAYNVTSHYFASINLLLLSVLFVGGFALCILSAIMYITLEPRGLMGF